MGRDSVRTCEAPGSALRVYHPQTALRLHLETGSLSDVATYVNVTQDAPTQERMWGAPRFSSCRNAGTPLGIQWLHDTLGRHPRSCSAPCAACQDHTGTTAQHCVVGSLATISERPEWAGGSETAAQSSTCPHGPLHSPYPT